jgi:hypothetical protein
VNKKLVTKNKIKILWYIFLMKDIIANTFHLELHAQCLNCQKPNGN